MKKAISLLLAMVMTLSLAVPVFAADAKDIKPTISLTVGGSYYLPAEATLRQSVPSTTITGKSIDNSESYKCIVPYNAFKMSVAEPKSVKITVSGTVPGKQSGIKCFVNGTALDSTTYYPELGNFDNPVNLKFECKNPFPESTQYSFYNITLIPSCEVTYDPNGGVIVTDNSANPKVTTTDPVKVWVQYGQNAPNQMISKKGYDFAGWYVSEVCYCTDDDKEKGNCDHKEFVRGAERQTTHMNLVAKWVAKPIELTTLSLNGSNKVTEDNKFYSEFTLNHPVYSSGGTVKLQIAGKVYGASQCDVTINGTQHSRPENMLLDTSKIDTTYNVKLKTNAADVDPVISKSITVTIHDTTLDDAVEAISQTFRIPPECRDAVTRKAFLTSKLEEILATYTGVTYKLTWGTFEKFTVTLTYKDASQAVTQQKISLIQGQYNDFELTSLAVNGVLAKPDETGLNYSVMLDDDVIKGLAGKDFVTVITNNGTRSGLTKISGKDPYKWKFTIKSEDKSFSKDYTVNLLAKPTITVVKTVNNLFVSNVVDYSSVTDTIIATLKKGNFDANVIVKLVAESDSQDLSGLKVVFFDAESNAWFNVVETGFGHPVNGFPLPVDTSTDFKLVATSAGTYQAKLVVYNVVGGAILAESDVVTVTAVVPAAPKNFMIGEKNYTTLSAAVDAAEAGDTILAYPSSGILTDTVTISKKLTITGVDAEGNKIVNASEVNCTISGVFTINAGNVEISGLEILQTASPAANFVINAANTTVQYCKFGPLPDSTNDRFGGRIRIATGDIGNTYITNNIFDYCGIETIKALDNGTLLNISRNTFNERRMVGDAHQSATINVMNGDSSGYVTVKKNTFTADGTLVVLNGTGSITMNANHNYWGGSAPTIGHNLMLSANAECKYYYSGETMKEDEIVTLP